jgi:hypothetical protein
LRFEFADGGVAESFAAAAAELDVVRGPVLAEQFTLRGEFADEGDEVLVVRGASRFEPQHGGSVHGQAVAMVVVLGAAVLVA